MRISLKHTFFALAIIAVLFSWMLLYSSDCSRDTRDEAMHTSILISSGVKIQFNEAGRPQKAILSGANGDVELLLLSKLTTIQHVRIVGCNRVSDAGISHVLQLPELEAIELIRLGVLNSNSNRGSSDSDSGNYVTDLALLSLCDSDTLELVQIYDLPFVTDEGVLALIESKIKHVSIYLVPVSTKVGKLAIQRQERPVN